MMPWSKCSFPNKLTQMQLMADRQKELLDRVRLVHEILSVFDGSEQSAHADIITICRHLLEGSNIPESCKCTMDYLQRNHEALFADICKFDDLWTSEN